MNGLEKKYNLVVVGAGLSGSVIAERASKLLGLKSLVIDKREHIGGNCYDYIDEHGIRTSLYGVHIFHTKYDRVKEYVSQFSEWIPYEHRVVAKAKDVKGNNKFVPMPPNIQTVNMLFGTEITKKEHPGTVIYREYSTDVGDPYYPVPNKRNKELYAKYQALAQQAKGVKFVGRLASYKYFNMDQAILNALEFFDSDIKNLNWSEGSE